MPIVTNVTPTLLFFYVPPGFNSVGCQVKVYDLRNTAAPVFIGAGHTQDVTGCKFIYSDDTVNSSNTTSEHVASCCKDGSICVWNLGMATHDNADNETAMAQPPVATLNTSHNYTSMTQLWSDVSVNRKLNEHQDPYILNGTRKATLCVGSFDGSLHAVDMISEHGETSQSINLEVRYSTPPRFSVDDAD